MLLHQGPGSWPQNHIRAGRKPILKHILKHIRAHTSSACPARVCVITSSHNREVQTSNFENKILNLPEQEGQVACPPFPSNWKIHDEMYFIYFVVWSAQWNRTLQAGAQWYVAWRANTFQSWALKIGFLLLINTAYYRIENSNYILL